MNSASRPLNKEGYNILLHNTVIIHISAPVCMCTCASWVCTPRSWQQWRRLQPYRCKGGTEGFLLQTSSRLDSSLSLPTVEDTFRLTQAHTWNTHTLTQNHSTYSERVGQLDSSFPVLAVVELEAVQTLRLCADHHLELWKTGEQQTSRNRKSHETMFPTLFNG